MSALGLALQVLSCFLGVVAAIYFKEWREKVEERKKWKAAKARMDRLDEIRRNNGG